MGYNNPQPPRSDPGFGRTVIPIAVLFAVVCCLAGMGMAGVGLYMTLNNEPLFSNPAPIVIQPTAAPVQPTPTIGSPTLPPPTLVAPTGFPTPTLPAAPTATSDFWSPCPAAYLSRLRVGMRAYVSFDPPERNRVREAPNTTSATVGFIEPGEKMDILDGPECSNDWIWWWVRSETGVRGWTAEGDENDYWLVPVP